MDFPPGSGVMEAVCKPIRIPAPDEKRKCYAEAGATLRGLLKGETDLLARMASIAAVLHHTLPHYFWTGFYRVVGDELVIGPYQGTPGCLRIARGRGVCGAAWARGETVIVADVHAFPGHIACDARSVSEIVVPWRAGDGRVVAVLDIDSTLPSAFDEVDREALEQLLQDWAPGG